MSADLPLHDTAARIIALATELGAEEVAAGVSHSAYSEITRRDHRIEQAKESISLSASVELLVDDRYSTHSTSDLRPEALRSFLERAVAATRHLQPDPNRRLPDAELLGVADVDLDLDDTTFVGGDPAIRRSRAEAAEAATHAALAGESVRSVTAYSWDGRSRRAVAYSNGFEARWSRTSFGVAASVSLAEADGRLPEAWSSCSTLHQSDLWDAATLAGDVAERARGRLASRPVASGSYSMLLDRRVVSRILGTLVGPLSGGAIYEQRSCLADKLGESVAASGFSMLDDPLIPRGAGSRIADGDGRPPVARKVIEDGVLKTFFIDVYNGRRLGMDPTTGGASNLIVPPGDQSVAELLAGLDQAIVVDGFLGGNANPTTGDFSFGIRGALFHKGERVQAVSEMNISGNILPLMQRFAVAANDPWTMSAWRCPSLLFSDVQFSGT